MTDRGERRRRTDRVVSRRCRADTTGYWKKQPGRLKKRPPVCYCGMCRQARKSPKKKVLEVGE